jgi:hypothetical protein
MKLKISLPALLCRFGNDLLDLDAWAWALLILWLLVYQYSTFSH